MPSFLLAESSRARGSRHGNAGFGASATENEKKKNSQDSTRKSSVDQHTGIPQTWFLLVLFSSYSTSPEVKNFFHGKGEDRASREDSRAICNVPAIHRIARQSYLRIDGQSAEKNSLLYHRGVKQSHTKPRTTTLERRDHSVTSEEWKKIKMEYGTMPLQLDVLRFHPIPCPLFPQPYTQYGLFSWADAVLGTR